MLPSNKIGRADQAAREMAWRNRVQGGIAFPGGSQQTSQWVVRLNLTTSDTNVGRQGLSRLCEGLTTFQNKTHDLFFSATLCFGYGFFDQLNILDGSKPQKLRPMPSDASELGDAPPDTGESQYYKLQQTDMLILLGASERAVIREALGAWPKRPDTPNHSGPTIVDALDGWAEIVEVHEGFRRQNTRNMLGFLDGGSNPTRLSDLFQDVVWTKEDPESKEPDDGTYLVFQKIVHDTDTWQKMATINVQPGYTQQEEYFGRHKATGVMIGTQFDPGNAVYVSYQQSYSADKRLDDRLRSPDVQVQTEAEQERDHYLEPQNDPSNPVFGVDMGTEVVGDTVKGCPPWSHIRRANPREVGQGTQHIIYRRSCLFVEDGPPPQSGILFLSFQKDIVAGFEFIKRVWLNPWREGTPNNVHLLDTTIFHALGGGYYYIPPVPGGDLSQIVQQFFG